MDRVKSIGNVVNLTTPLGLLVAWVGGASVRRGPRGLLLGHGFRWRFPPAAAFTVGNVVITRYDEAWLASRPRLLAHEERHSWQYLACLGLPMIPLYLLAAGWSLLRGGDPAVHNVFERLAGLADGGYPTVTRRRRPR